MSKIMPVDEKPSYLAQLLAMENEGVQISHGSPITGPTSQYFDHESGGDSLEIVPFLGFDPKCQIRRSSEI